MNMKNEKIAIVQRPIPIKDKESMQQAADKSFQMMFETLSLMQKELNDLRQRVYNLEHP